MKGWNAAPRQSSCGIITAEAGDGLRVLAAQFAVDHQELLDGRPGGFHLGRGVEDGGHDTIEQRVGQLNPAGLRRFREDPEIEGGPRRVARPRPREDVHRRVGP